jgi:uncharacterized protein (DUF305 family)
MANNENIVVNLDIAILVRELVANKAFIKALALEIRNAQTKDSRRMQNLYGTTAQRPSPKPATKGRLS